MTIYGYADCHYAEFFMLIVTNKSVMLNAVMLSVIMLNVVSPLGHLAGSTVADFFSLKLVDRMLLLGVVCLYGKTALSKMIFEIKFKIFVNKLN
jgi:hypothetical protein